MAGSLPGMPGQDDSRPETEQLHAAMAQATAHLGAVRVDRARLRRAQRRHRLFRLSEGGAVAGVLSVALVTVMVTTHGGGGGGAGTRRASTPASASTPPPGSAYRTILPGPYNPRADVAHLLKPVSVSVYDSDDGSEGRGPSVNGLLKDAGSWSTNLYCQNRPTLGGVPKGTGLIFTLADTTLLSSATVDIAIPGASLEMWTAEDPTTTAIPAVRPGQPPAGFKKVAAVTSTGVKAVLKPAKPVKTRLVLIWFSGKLPVATLADPKIKCANSDGKLYGDTIAGIGFTRAQ